MIPQNWKQPKCPPTAEWVNKVWWRYKTDYYTAMRMLQEATTQMNHKVLNERSKHKEYIKCNSITICSTVGICFMYCSIYIYIILHNKKAVLELKNSSLHT